MKKKITALIVVLLLAAALALGTYMLVPAARYRRAEELLDGGQYEKARAAFNALGAYRDSRTRAEDIQYERDYAYAVTLLDARRYEEAILA